MTSPSEYYPEDLLSIWWRRWVYFFAKKGWEWMEWKYILIPWTPGPPHLILAHPHTHDIYTRLIFIIAKKAVVLQIKKNSTLLKIFNFPSRKNKRRKSEEERRVKPRKFAFFWIKTVILRRKTVNFIQKRPFFSQKI